MGVTMHQILGLSRQARWYDVEYGKGGDLLDLIARERGVDLAEALRIAEREYLGGFAVPSKSQQSVLANDVEARMGAALRIWRESMPLAGTLGERYLIEHRQLDVRHLAFDHALRWHADCQAIVALMRDPISMKAIGIHRTFLDADRAKFERKKASSNEANAQTICTQLVPSGTLCANRAQRGIEQEHGDGDRQAERRAMTIGRRATG